MLVVGTGGPIQMDDGSIRKQGEPIPEAAKWVRLKPWLDIKRIVEVPDPPPFDFQELLELADVKRLHDFATRRGLDSKGLERKDLIAALLISAGLTQR